MMSRTSSPSESPGPMKRSRKSYARKVERACCSIIKYFPLAFVYGVTTWAVWVLGHMAFRSDSRSALSEFSESAKIHATNLGFS